MRSCLILHSWWGLNADARAFADRLRSAGHVVATPDLYGNGRVATTIDEAKELLAARDLAAVNRELARLNLPLLDPKCEKVEGCLPIP